MTTFADYAWAPFSPAQLTAMGFTGVMRYISHDGSKDITAPEIANLRAAGFDIGIVYESTANRSTQGFAAGHDDAVFANAQLDALGYPSTCLVTYAVDFDAQPSQVQPYFDGVAAAQLRPSAPYGSFTVVEGVHYPAPFAWQTAAWSGGRISSRAGLLQNGFHNTYDSNLVLVADFGQWKAHPTPQPVPQEELMLPVVILSVAGSGQLLWNLPANKLVTIPDPADSAALAGVPVWSVDQAFVDSIKASA